MLVESPLKWHLMEMSGAAPVRHPVVPVIAERGGTQLRAPRAVAVIDTREQNPFSFRRFARWFEGVEERALPLGDYSVCGMEDSCIVERKSLADLIHSFTVDRAVFVARLRRMSQIAHPLLVITSSLSEVKSRYPYSAVDPNQITQSLLAVLIGLRVPFLCADTHTLGAEMTASFLYQVHLHNWLDANGYGRCLSDSGL
ncbi:MAG TPA: ERCC4 domain-containing protein [Verrucomicrobiae bacterium]|nr:ERCC4 domain-containing protein [Verrucomicrobiae bacterium]